MHLFNNHSKEMCDFMITFELLSLYLSYARMHSRFLCDKIYYIVRNIFLNIFLFV